MENMGVFFFYGKTGESSLNVATNQGNIKVRPTRKAGAKAMQVYQFQDYHLRMTVYYSFLFPNSSRLHICGEFLLAWKEDHSLRPSHFHKEYERANPMSPGFRTFVNMLRKIEQESYASLPDLLLSLISNREAILSYLAMHPLRREDKGASVYATWTWQELHEALLNAYGSGDTGLSISADESYVRKLLKEFVSIYLIDEKKYTNALLGIARIEKKKPSISFPADDHYTRALSCEVKFLDAGQDDPIRKTETIRHSFSAQVSAHLESSKQIYRKGFSIASAYQSLTRVLMERLPNEIQTAIQEQAPGLDAVLEYGEGGAPLDILILFYPSPFAIPLIEYLRTHFNTHSHNIDIEKGKDKMTYKAHFHFALVSKLGDASFQFAKKRFMITKKPVPVFDDFDVLRK